MLTAIYAMSGLLQAFCCCFEAKRRRKSRADRGILVGKCIECLLDSISGTDVDCRRFHCRFDRFIHCFGRFLLREVQKVRGRVGFVVCRCLNHSKHFIVVDVVLK